MGIQSNRPQRKNQEKSPGKKKLNEMEANNLSGYKDAQQPEKGHEKP